MNKKGCNKMIKYIFSLAIIFSGSLCAAQIQETLSAFLMVIHWKYYRIKKLSGSAWQILMHRKRNSPLDAGLPLS